MERYSFFDKFVEEVMGKILEGDDPVLETLRLQYNCATIKDIELTGVGFYISYLIPEHAPRIQGKKSFYIGDLSGEIEGINDGVGFVLFVKDGIIDLLEGHTYGDEKWPEVIVNYKLSFTSGKKRNVEQLKAKWQ
ncbi:hypothetical protein [Anoxybacteroides tepidamans]|uniref:hypothetical protein n=1 Tax=Anoxybacteroides tepidamans TaxID=265948 RepID=UPI000489451C|nr:hypothetical protein [Anoxybacillus tepidamans]